MLYIAFQMPSTRWTGEGNTVHMTHHAHMSLQYFRSHTSDKFFCDFVGWARVGRVRSKKVPWQESKFRSREWNGIFLLFSLCGWNNLNLLWAQPTWEQRCRVAGSLPRCHIWQDRRETLYEMLFNSVSELFVLDSWDHKTKTWDLIFDLHYK